MAHPHLADACLVFLLALCLATSADARHWKWWYYGGHDRFERGERDDDGGSRRACAAELPDPALRGSSGAFGTIVERLVSGCGQQADQLISLEAGHPPGRHHRKSEANQFTTADYFVA
jgi:hypothetical protein